MVCVRLGASEIVAPALVVAREVMIAEVAVVAATVGITVYLKW